MSQKFHSEIKQGDGVAFVKLNGVIDEDNELGETTEKVVAGTVLINLAEVERINSCGVRDWVNWLGKIEKNGAKPVLVECSPAIVAQINLVNNFTGNGAVKSFFAPYFCPQCDREKVLLVDTADLVGRHPVKAPTCRCDECDGVMDFDDMEDSYFAFLSNAKKVAADVNVEKLLAKLVPDDAAEKNKVRTRVGSTGVSSPGGTGPGQSLPSVPSLPGTARAVEKSAAGSRPGGTPPQLSGRPVTATGAHRLGLGPGEIAAPAPSATGNRMLYVVVALLLLATIALLAVVVLRQRSASSSQGRSSLTVAVARSIPLESELRSSRI